MVTNRIIFFATSVQPNPEEIDYWVDLSDNPYGGSIKYFNGTEWVRLAASGGIPDLSNYYTKTQVNKLLNDKANISDVDSKVDDEEVKDVIKDIQFNTSNPNDITMVMFKYDGSNKTVSIPVASTSSAGIITSKDFLDFVKQHQLQELHTEMIDTFADIRAKYQKKLIAGLNIEIDQETNVISASGDLAVQWDNITNKPDFKPVATSGDYNDLINKLKPGKDVSISEDNVISIAIEGSIQEVADNLAQEILDRTQADTTINNDVEDLTGQVLILEKTKVNKVEGKGLSTNDYTTPEKNKLAAIEAEANKYVLPAATASALGGIKIGSNITLADGGTISITKANVTSALGVDPTTKYVTLDTTQTITEQKTFSKDIIFNNTLTGIYNAGGNLIFGAGTEKIACLLTDYFGPVEDKTNTINLGNKDGYWKGVHAGRLISYAANGTAPIQVSSTTLCTNLNADMVDGYGVSEFNGNSISVKYSINSVNQANAENWIKVCTLPLVDQEITQDKKAVFEIVGGADSGEKYTYYGILTASTRYVENVELRILSSMAIPSVAVFIAGYVVTSNEVEIWIRTSAQWGTNTNIVCKWASTHTNNILSSPATTQRPSNFVLGNIKTLDAPDWYGVSWSETSSNPNCVRIGNMDMHRSLPIQSMMKPFDITNIKDTVPEIILPIDDQFQKTSYANANNNQWSIVSTGSDNIMIRIPEFWYTDEYIPKSNTHNLKICPHAKPGWYHHKEAYVGAYELCETSPSSGKVCSAKGLIPLVGRTREALRKAVRGSGFDGEAKWNLYTYEEHRAICHLFLVEYATRNSQKAVNTELTPEGFRQGGLGSGCTTGTATINGAQTWSFIPTGSSDSLGSGSGEVTVTIQQTDSSGSNTSTITRKCNRYRGIENPFGHIWKHTDDVISVYGNGYRTWYKSVKPNQFATNKNTSYKPFCASTMVSNGYKTEIKATPTCDFFATSVSGGSETTYWCDYNWDNTDTSEHCLLIGGHSGHGGAAGLFLLYSSYGVGYSHAYIGSRLTYLPWAE